MLGKIKAAATNKNARIFVIMLLAIATRLIALGQRPSGVLPDEAYGAYNAWSLMTEGIDSRGYSYPVYFVAWGSGMNALYSYLAIPLFYLFGSSIAVYRLPQAILGITSVYAFYLLIKELWNPQIGEIASFALAINPWHIMNMRFGLESNMAPGLFLLGVLFLILGFNHKRIYFIFSAVALGMTLYCYALTWLMIPLFFLLFTICLRRQFFELLHSSSGIMTLVGFAFIIFLFALPLLLFVGINLNLMEEIRTPYISIPKLLGFRGGELQIKNIGGNLGKLLDILLSQYDGVSYTANRTVGAYYLFTAPFVLIGIAAQLKSIFRDRGKQAFQCVMFTWLISALLVSIINENITMIHINMVHIPIIFYGAYGIWCSTEFLKSKYLMPIYLFFWLFSFGIFLSDYAIDADSYFIQKEADEALERAKGLSAGPITIFDYTSIKYSYLLWYEKPLASDFVQNVVYIEDPSWQELGAYGRYRYIGSHRLENITTDSIYILPTHWVEFFDEKGFEIEYVNARYCIAYIRQ